MKEDLRKTLENEGQRTELLHKKLRELEQALSLKDKESSNKEKMFTKLSHKCKKLKKNNKELIVSLNELKNQHESALKLNEQLQSENSQYKDSQLDFQTILNEKIEQITRELKGEREKRLAEQAFSRVFSKHFAIFQ